MAKSTRSNLDTEDSPPFWGDTHQIKFNSERDYFLTKACYHEAAHLAVLLHFGGEGYAYVWGQENAAPDDRPFIGQMAYRPNCVSSEQFKLVGLAGTIAECILLDRDRDPYDLWDSIDSGCDPLSDSDAALVGDYTEADIEAVIVLLESIWPEVEEIANDTRDVFELEEVAA